MNERALNDILNYELMSLTLEEELLYKMIRVRIYSCLFL